jgi:hypothetical protein
MGSSTESELIRDACREAAAAPRDARHADVAPPSPRCAEILHVLNRILDAEAATLAEDA